MRIVGLSKFSMSILLTGALIGAVSCEKDDDEETTTAAPVVGGGATGSTVVPGSLMLGIDTTCGGDPCIQTGAALRLEGDNDESFVQTVRGFYWLVTGFPDSESHEGFVPEGAHKIVPEAGLTGRIENVRAHVVETLIANSSGLTTCADVPASGSFEVADDGTYTLAVPKNSAPASYPKTGTYDKRIEYVGKDFDAVFEWFCDYAGMMVKMAPKDSKGKSIGFNYAFYYDREDAEDGHFEFFLSDEGKGALGSEPMALALKVNVLKDTFRIWMTQYAIKEDAYGSYRAVGHTNIASQETSLWYQDIHGSGLTKAAWTASDIVTSEAIPTVSAPAESGELTDARQGCATNFDMQAHDIATNTLCDDLDLKKASAPALDADGDWSMLWVQKNLAKLLETL